MQLNLLEILRCPLCGAGLQLQQTPSPDARPGSGATGILSCECARYPVLSGIPYICADSTAERVLDLLDGGQHEQALFALLGLQRRAQKQLAWLLANHQTRTFRKALHVLSPDAEGTYFLYRFSDPTFLSSQAILQAVSRDRRIFRRRVLDVGGGLGQLTRSLCHLARDSEVILTDVSFPKLWLAKQFVAPYCQPICCDASSRLPFTEAAFSLIFCSDAFHYIRSKWMLAREMARLSGEDGTIILAHLHNSLAENYSAGWPLSASGYRSLFEGFCTKIFKESEFLSAMLHRRFIDLSVSYSDDDLSNERAIVLIATSLVDLFRQYELSDVIHTGGTLAINPLYRLEHDERGAYLARHFPSLEYEKEFADCKLYLPDRVDVLDADEAALKALKSGNHLVDSGLRDALGPYVVLEVPKGYV